jgi:hypothetical protein
MYQKSENIRDVIFPPFRGNPPFDSILEKIKTFGFDLK